MAWRSRAGRLEEGLREYEVVWGLVECALLLLVTGVGNETALFVGTSVLFNILKDLDFLDGGKIMVWGCLRVSVIYVVSGLQPVISSPYALWLFQ